jgi:hypothetical protein
MTLESIIALATGALALGSSIWAHRRISVAKVQAPVTKAELYGVTTRGGVPVPMKPKDPP